MTNEIIWLYLIPQVILLMVVEIKFGIAVGIITWCTITIVHYWVSLLVKNGDKNDKL